MQKKSNSGNVTLPVLVFCLLLLQLVVASLPYFDNTLEMVIKERNRLQARYNADAGVWLGFRDWSKQTEPNKTYTYSLSNGSVKVNITSDSQVIQIKSIGTAFDSKDGIEATYDVVSEKFIHWHQITE